MSTVIEYSAEKYTEDRVCGTCVECCTGCLSTQVYEYQVSKNSPCHFLDLCEKNCSIYENRPQVCKDYKCLWLEQKVLLPNWMKPEYSKVLISNWFVTTKDKKQLNFWAAVECGQIISSEALNWLFRTCKNIGMNLSYEVNGTKHFIGDEDFLNHVQNTNGNIFHDFSLSN